MALVIVEETISYRSVCEDPFLRDHIDSRLYLGAFHIVTIGEETDRQKTDNDRYDDHELDEGEAFLIHTNFQQEILSA